MGSKFHSGELGIQEKFGELQTADRVGRMIGNSIIPGASAFLENQHSVVVSSIDMEANIWVSFLVGNTGLAKVNPNLKSLSFDRSKIASPTTDIFYSNITENKEVGVIFIELGSRRRYRVNGMLRTFGTTMELAIEEAYPNCPKYIQRRLAKSSTETQKANAVITKGTELQAGHLEWIKKADTLFVGTRSDDRKLDASHRGGNPGFVEVLEDGTLKIPDYQGNMMYNSLGNIAQNNKAGLLFLDFEQKRTLQLSGEAKLLFDQTSKTDHIKTTGTGRYWLFSPKAWIQTNDHHGIDWEYLDASPFNPEI